MAIVWNRRGISQLALAALSLLGSAPALLADILPEDRRTVWNPGIQGGIPVADDRVRHA